MNNIPTYRIYSKERLCSKERLSRISASLEFWREILNEHLPQMSTPFFSEKGTILDKTLETNLQS